MPVATPWIPMLPLGTAETSRWKELEHHSHACICELWLLWFWEHDAHSTRFIIDMHLLRSCHHDNLDRLQLRWLFHSASSMHMMCLGLCTIPAWSCPTLLKGTCWREPMFCDRCNLSSSLTFGIMCPNSNHKSVADCIRTISTAGCRYCRYAVGELIHAIAWLAVRATWNTCCAAGQPLWLVLWDLAGSEGRWNKTLGTSRDKGAFRRPQTHNCWCTLRYPQLYRSGVTVWLDDLLQPFTSISFQLSAIS